MQALELLNLIHNQMGYAAETNVGTPTIDETDVTLGLMNMVIKSMQNKKAWPDLRTKGRLETDAPSTSGAYASVTYGDKTLTLTGGSDFFEAGDVGKLVQVGSYKSYYRIASYTGTKEVELEDAWREDTDTLQIVVMAQDRYSLPSDLDQLLDKKLLNLVTGQEIKEISPGEMRDKRQLNGMTLLQNEPQFFTIYGEDSSTNKYIHFDRVGNDDYILEYDYQRNHGDLTANTDEILYPEKYALFIVDRVVAMLQRDLENMQNAMQTMSEALQEEAQIYKNPDNSADRMRIAPSTSLYGAYRRR